MKADLHCHTTLSDGQLTPPQVIERASLNEVDMLAITDHDTSAAFKLMQPEADRNGIQLLAGIEFSSQWHGKSIHVVGLNVDVNSEVLVQAEAQQKQTRTGRARMIGERLARLGLENTYAGAMEIAGDSQIGRPHFARYMVQTGMVQNMEKAFKKYLGSGKPGDIKSQWPPMRQVIAWIRQSGGHAVLAHPAKYRMTNTKLRGLLRDFKEAGGEAMEVVSASQNRDITDHHARLCDTFELHASCGSDFHGPVSNWSDIGKFQPLPSSCRPVWQLWC